MGERRRGEEVGRREEYIWKGRRERKGRRQETYLEGWERGRSKGIHCEEGEKRKFKEGYRKRRRRKKIWEGEGEMEKEEEEEEGW